MEKKKLATILAFITPSIIEKLMHECKINYKKASTTFYKSKLYKALEDESTGLWKLSSLALYSILEEELKNETINFLLGQ